MKTLFCIIGRTCAGKDTLAKQLCERFPELFRLVCSYTTRPMRETEEQGREHKFVSAEEFHQLMVEKTPIAYTKIGDYEYMALKEDLENENVYIIDPSGVKYIQEHFPEIPLVQIYVWAPYNVRKRRALYSRGDGCENFINRHQSEDRQFSEYEQHGLYDISIDTGDNLSEIAAQATIFKKLLSNP